MASLALPVPRPAAARDGVPDEARAEDLVAQGDAPDEAQARETVAQPASSNSNTASRAVSDT